MRRAILWSNAFAIALTLASALAVLASWVTDPGYRRHYGDSLPFLVGYTGLQVWMLSAFLRDTRAVPWIAIARAVAGWLFIALFVSIGPLWMRVSPARYVYQLFDWGTEARTALFALVFLGRGAFNTFSAFVLTRDWWWSLRERRPLLGRLVTALPIAAIVSGVWLFAQMVRLDARTFSAEAHEVAMLVLDGIDCETLRARQGQTTTDLRQRGERRYHVTVRWRCREVQVEVRTEDGRIGVARAPRPECCPDARGADGGRPAPPSG